jgi:phosphoglucosamine mutase
MSRLFGTDGIRGVANSELTPELAMQIGRAVAVALPNESGEPILVGRDTRVSGTMLEAALIAGITSAGRDATGLGIVPTPAVAIVTRAVQGAAGIMISASHNPIADNGIKIFGSDGFKLSDEVEDRVESLLDSTDLSRPIGTGVGVARLAQNLGRHYYQALYEGAADLSSLHVIVDGGCGAAYAIAPYALRKLGARVTELNCEADGARINVACGTTDLRGLQAAVQARIDAGERNVLGVAFDGDADRALFIDETGAVVTGDHVLFALGCSMKAHDELTGNGIVATVMSNVGFERALRAHGIGLVRAAVGDRYVLEAMLAGGFALGGEQSGHVIDFRHNSTGDGPRTAISLLSVVVAKQTTLHDLVREVVYAPQLLVNVRTDRREILEAVGVQEEIAAANAALGDTGRLVVRPSGTEPLIRVMAEADDRRLVEEVVQRVALRIEQEISRRIST